MDIPAMTTDVKATNNDLERLTISPSENDFTFTVKTCSRAVIRLKPDVDSAADYEIVIDEDFVTKIIKKPDSSEAEEVARTNTYFLVDCDNFR